MFIFFKRVKVGLECPPPLSAKRITGKPTFPDWGQAQINMSCCPPPLYTVTYCPPLYTGTLICQPPLNTLNNYSTPTLSTNLLLTLPSFYKLNYSKSFPFLYKFTYSLLPPTSTQSLIYTLSLSTNSLNLHNHTYLLFLSLKCPRFTRSGY